MNQIYDSWLPHLVELRRRLLICAISGSLVFLILLYFAKGLYHLAALPLLRHLPQNGHLIATSLTAPIVIPVKLAFYVSLTLMMPVCLYQLWAFIAPGLYPHERIGIVPLLITSVVLFVAGSVAAYFLVFPLLFRFFAYALPPDVVMMTDMGVYLSFILKTLMAFGLIFEVPIVVFLCARFKIISLKNLQQARPYVIVGAFILGMLLGPPEVISQITLALPIWWLFELGVVMVRWFGNKERGGRS
jgi:sec-independent protein translocase protein TatC